MQADGGLHVQVEYCEQVLAADVIQQYAEACGKDPSDLIYSLNGSTEDMNHTLGSYSVGKAFLSVCWKKEMIPYNGIALLGKRSLVLFFLWRSLVLYLLLLLRILD